MQGSTFVQIQCRRGSLAGQTYYYIDPEPRALPSPLLIGRDPSAHICFASHAERMVSRRHVEVHCHDNALHLVDSNSTHGLYAGESRQRIEKLTIKQGSSLDVQLGLEGPVCHFSV